MNSYKKDLFENDVNTKLNIILDHDLAIILKEYEDLIFMELSKENYLNAEEHLTDFCFKILDLTDQEQLFLARTYFTSIITELIRKYSRKNRLHPKLLAYSLVLIKRIESWGNITEYLLYIPWFIDIISTKIITAVILNDGNKHIDKAIILIHTNLTNKDLSVSWIAKNLSISTTHLSNQFKLQINETIGSYIMKEKMNEIMFEIKYTSKSLKTIRERYHFYNTSHFGQCFKKHTGITPLKYKQNLFK